MIDNRELLELYSPVREIVYNKSLNTFMENKKPLVINEVLFSKEEASKQDVLCPFNIYNTDYIFSFTDILLMKSNSFDKRLEQVEIAGKLSELSEYILTNNLLQAYELKLKNRSHMRRTGLMNNIMIATNNLLFYYLINPHVGGRHYDSLKIYDYTVDIKDGRVSQSCSIIELGVEEKGATHFSYLLIHYPNPELALIYLLSPNPYKGLLPFAVILEDMTIRLVNVNSTTKDNAQTVFAVEEDIESILKENWEIETLEALNGKVYPKFNTDYNTIMESILGKENLNLIESSIINGSTENTVYTLGEGAITNASRKAKAKIIKADRNVSGKIDKLADDVKETVKKSLLPNAREDIIKDSFPSLSKLIKVAAGLGVAYAINPAIAALAAFTGVVIKRKVTRDERRKLLAELKEEYELVEEKIKDAESKGDNKNKYQLMRLRNKLKTSIERISYGNNFVDNRSSV